MEEAPFAGMMGIENGSLQSEDWLDAKQYQQDVLMFACFVATYFFCGWMIYMFICNGHLTMQLALGP